MIAVGSDELRSDGVWDFPGVEAYRRSGAAPSSDQSLAPSDLQYEMERKKPVWIVLVFFAVMVGVSLWLLATNTADPDELPGAGGVVHAES